jgi:hypothetical protein
MMRLPEGVVGDALFLGDNREHRLWLERRLSKVGPAAPYALWIGMNPSVAGANEDDMTVRKEWIFTCNYGLSRYVKMNVGTYVCTDPTKLPLGLLTHPSNDDALRCALPNAAAIVMATASFLPCWRWRCCGYWLSCVTANDPFFAWAVLPTVHRDIPAASATTQCWWSSSCEHAHLGPLSKANFGRADDLLHAAVPAVWKPVPVARSAKELAL